MNEVLDKFNWLLQQAYIYIPMIMSFMTAIGLPSIIQLAKIFASAKLYLTQVRVLVKKVNECVNVINRMSRFMDDFIEREVKYTEELETLTTNKKQKALILKHKLDLIGMKVESAKFRVENIAKAELPSKPDKTIKVRVRKVD